MFATHQPRIATFARANHENFARVLKFVVLTIRTRLYNVPADMGTLDAPPSADALASVLYGWKIDAIDQIEREAESLYVQAEEIFYHAADRREAEEGLLNLFTSIVGLGLAKAGFACQLIYGVSACLDSHNIERFSLDAKALRADTFKRLKTLSRRAARISQYCDMVDTCGGTEHLWNSWCEYVFARPDPTGYKLNGNVSAYKSADHVSGLHCDAIGV